MSKINNHINIFCNIDVGFAAMNLKVYIFLLLVTSCLAFNADKPNVGAAIDSLNGVKVYYNGPFDKTYGRNVTADGYNLGLKYQCVEFVKRYYYKRFKHKMPDSYGHAVQFFNHSIPNESAYNRFRGLYQYRNGNTRKPQPEDIVVFKTEGINIFGHIGIISKVNGNQLEMVQQNYGTKTRIKYNIVKVFDRYYIDDKEVVGWLSFN